MCFRFLKSSERSLVCGMSFWRQLLENLIMTSLQMWIRGLSIWALYADLAHSSHSCFWGFRTGFQTVWMTITMVMMMTMMRNHHKGGCACIRLFWTAMNSNKGYDNGLGWDQKRERASVQGLVEDIAKQGSERIVWNELFLAARWLSGSWLLMFSFLVF